MRFKIKQNHMVDFLFPLALLFVFALSALTVSLFATKIYQSTVEDSARSNSARTALSYVTEKIHSHDTNGCISIGTFDGLDAVIMNETYHGKEYITYIYFDDGQLKELFVTSGFNGNSSNGTSVMKVKEFTMKETDNNLLEFICRDNRNKSFSITVAIRSRN